MATEFIGDPDGAPPPPRSAELGGELERALEVQPLSAVEQEPSAKAHQACCMERRVVREAVASAKGADAPQLLDVDVQELAGAPLLVAADRLGRLKAEELAEPIRFRTAPWSR
jgi:hypothetical protein